MAAERTLSIIKPDAVAKNVIGEIYSRFEKAGLKVIAARMAHLSQKDAEGFYAVHKGRPFFDDLVKFMISGPVMIQVLERESAITKNRDLMGATDPKKAAAGTVKWIFDVGSANGIETVCIPEEDRGTLCVSSQVGCALDCKFCSTGRQGFNRDLSVAEIIAQLWVAVRQLRTADVQRPVTNVVMMGMGEPLNNFEPVVDAMSIMLDDHAYGLSRRRVTLSTSGVVPNIRKLKDALPVALAVSLHAPNDELRSRIMPINQAYPIAELLDACRDYLEVAPRDFITFEYVMLEGVNDAPEHARELVKVLADVPSKVNLIPFNPFPDSGFGRTD